MIRLACSEMIFFRCTMRSVGVNAAPSLLHAVERSPHPSPRVRTLICSFSASSLALLLVSDSSSFSAFAAVFQQASDPHFS